MRRKIFITALILICLFSCVACKNQNIQEPVSDEKFVTSEMEATETVPLESESNETTSLISTEPVESIPVIDSFGEGANSEEQAEELTTSDEQENIDETETTPLPAKEPVVQNQATRPSNNSGGVYNTWDSLVGTLSIPDVGLSVNCYASAEQATADADNSAAYFYTQGHLVIGDHVNQGFHKIKSCREGTVAYVPYGSGTVEYECVAVINGINTGYGLETTDGRDISELYPGSVVCYTCNDNWQSVTIVFFQLPGGETPEEFEGDSTEFYPSEENSNICPAGKHKWELEDSFQYIDITDTHRIKYNQDHYVCSKCGSDYLNTQELKRWPIEDKDWWVNEYGDKVTDPEPIDPPNETPTESPVQETEPPVEEPAPLPEETTPPTEPSTEPPQEEPSVEETTPPTEPPVEAPEPDPTPELETTPSEPEVLPSEPEPEPEPEFDNSNNEE